jgi:hypothetical protein
MSGRETQADRKFNPLVCKDVRSERVVGHEVRIRRLLIIEAESKYTDKMSIWNFEVNPGTPSSSMLDIGFETFDNPR